MSKNCRFFVGQKNGTHVLCFGVLLGPEDGQNVGEKSRKWKDGRCLPFWIVYLCTIIHFSISHSNANLG